MGSFILIIPWTYIGIQQNGILTVPIVENIIELSITFATYAIICYAILLSLSVYAFYTLMRKLIRNLENFDWDAIKRFYSLDLVLFLIIIMEYFFLQLILPVRGFDAMHYYFPEAEVFYLSDQISDINYLSFSPVVKAPLNVLFFTFSLYISQSQSYQIYPLLFLIGSSLLAYDLSMELWGEKAKARLAMLVFLVTPVVYWTMSYWAFYQELFVGYFVGAAFYFAWRGINRNKGHSPSFIFPAILSMALALLSKINAWIMFIVLILAIPTQRWGKILQLLLLGGLTSFLIARSITNIFIGTGIVIFLFSAYVAYLILKRPLPEKTPSLASTLAFITGSVILGGFWLINRMSKSESFIDELNNLYFMILNSISWEFNGSSIFEFDLILERMQAVNFWSASFFFFLGIAFCLPWITPKIIAMIKGMEINHISIWISVFFMVWMTYYFQGSVRYLSPIFIPLAVLIVHGFDSLLNIFKIPKESIIPRAVLLCFGVMNFYFLIPLNLAKIGDNTQELVGNAYNRSAFAYYSHPEIALLQALLFTLLWIVLLTFISDNPSKLKTYTSNLLYQFKIALNTNNLQRIKTSLVVILLIIVILVPIAVQGYTLMSTSGDIEEFQGIMEYEYNEDYRAVIDQIKKNIRITGGIITVRMPGVQIHTLHPTLDFYYQHELLGDRFYQSSNITYLVELLKNPLENLFPQGIIEATSLDFTFELIVVPNISNIYYNIYNENIWSRSSFFQSLSNEIYFDLIYENSRYQLYRIK